MTVTIDFSTCTNWMEVHELLRDSLDFPPFYGMNLAALWDCLTGFMDTLICIQFIHTSSLAGDVKHEVEDILPIFMRAASKDDELQVVVLS